MIFFGQWYGQVGGDDTIVQLANDMNLDVIVNGDNPPAYKSDILVHNLKPSVHVPSLTQKILSTKEMNLLESMDSQLSFGWIIY